MFSMYGVLPDLACKREDRTVKSARSQITDYGRAFVLYVRVSG